MFEVLWDSLDMCPLNYGCNLTMDHSDKSFDLFAYASSVLEQDLPPALENCASYYKLVQQSVLLGWMSPLLKAIEILSQKDQMAPDRHFLNGEWHCEIC
ncbi:hypothetical protein AKJ16_DCAP13913 [Drosera capensis]